MLSLKSPSYKGRHRCRASSGGLCGVTRQQQLTDAAVPAHRASGPRHTRDCSQSARSRTPLCKVQPSLEPQPDLSLRPLASALRKPVPGTAGKPPPRKGCVLPTTCLPAPRCSPLQEQGGSGQTLTAFPLGQSCCCQQAGTGEDTDGLGFLQEKHWAGPRSQESGLETGRGSSGFRKEAKG